MLGHSSSERINHLADQNVIVPKLDRDAISTHEYVSCLLTETQRSYIPDSTRKTIYRLEFLHPDISRLIEPSVEIHLYIAVFFDELIGRSDVKMLNKRSELSQSLTACY